MKQFPRLYNLEQFKDCRLRDRRILQNENWEWSWCWRTNPTGRPIDDLVALCERIGNIQLSLNTSDGWIWLLEKNCTFTVRTLSSLVDEKLLGPLCFGKRFSWNNFAPKKVNIFLWRTCLDRLPHFANLSKLGIQINLPMCPICNLVPETRDHILVSCSRIRTVWYKIFSWWKLSFSAFTLKELVDCSFLGHSSTLVKKIIQ